jgi:hypothetical protein
MSDEWSDWIEHDGGVCPCVGQFIHAVFDQWHPLEYRGFAAGFHDAWVHDVPPAARRKGRVIRYRIRKPRGLTMLEEIAKDVREPVDA